MTYEIPGQMVSFESDIDLSTSQYCGVVIGTDGFVDLAGDDVKIVGVLQNKPKPLGAGGTAAASVMLNGITKAVAASAITAGSQVETASDGTGRFEVFSTGPAVGIALEAAANANDLFPMRLYEN